MFVATENIVLSSAQLLLFLYIQLYRQDHTEQETEQKCGDTPQITDTH